MRAPARVALAVSAALLPLSAGRAAAPDVRLYTDVVATDPGTDAFAALLARGSPLRPAGLPAFGQGVITTESDDSTAWITGLTRTARLRSAAGQPELTDDTAGFAAGIDRRFGEDAIGGVSVAHTQTSFSSGRTEGATSATSVGLYGAAAWGSILYGSAGAAYTFSDTDARLGHQATHLSPGTVRAGGTLGHFIDFSGFTFNPLVEVEYARTDGQSLQQDDQGAIPVNAPGQETLAFRGGLRINSAGFRWGILASPHVSVLWERRLIEQQTYGTLARIGSSGVVSGGLVLSLPHGIYAGFDVGTRFGSALDERTALLSLAAGF